MTSSRNIQYPETARIQPIAPDELKARLSDTNGARFDNQKRSYNIYRTIGNNPALMNAWLPLGGYLLYNNDIPGRDREVLILRTAINCGSLYEWEKHVKIAAAEGITDEEIQQIKSFARYDSWDEWTGALLSAADELHTDSCISDDTWQLLTARYSVEQMIALPMLVGQYHMIAFMLRSAGVQKEQ